MTETVKPHLPARHRWLPLTVLVVTVAWWLETATDLWYATLSQMVVGVIAGVLVSVWYLWLGRPTLRFRAGALGSIWGAALLLLAIFKPIYNGDVGIVGWRLRFAATHDESLIQDKQHAVATDLQTTPRDYPRFLGNGYWPEVADVELNHDWKTHPPQLVWRREIGAGWSSFAVVGNYAFTQEQRGNQELVSCYRLIDGAVVWTHADPVRFDPSDIPGGVGGAGPRATPTVFNGKVFTQGATGIVNCFDARTGTTIWSHDTIAETGATLLEWGKSGSPLIVDDKVIISVGAPKDEELRKQFAYSLVAYDVQTGHICWHNGSRSADYASPFAATICREQQIIVVNEGCVSAHRIRDGKVLWEHPWSKIGDTQDSAVQPIPLPGDRLFLCKGYGIGAALWQIRQNQDGQFAVEPQWNPSIIPVMKSKFSSVVVRDGYIYGLDDVLLECIELQNGKVIWKARRRPVFGHGQIILVGDSLLVVSECGELALVEASPTGYHEIGCIQALDPDDPTWNNPAFSAPYLVVRNAHEAACYRLSLATNADPSKPIRANLAERPRFPQ
jgi:outer membrane protein assembly factor BamB